ncbi:MAG TPA: hypothetical protein PK576_10775, partial [Kiritimatiellia bacterium]|nr:hypothetical protein [Kiritimatiellia bacterium]
AYGGPVTLTLDPLPGTLAGLPGATNGPWLCGMSILPARSNTVVFADGQTPPPPPGNPDSVDGLLLLSPPPSGAVHALTSPPPSAVLQPLRMTAGVTVLGNGGWYCLRESSLCSWPDYDMIGCDPVSMAMIGVTGDTPLLSREAALQIFWARHPCVQCTVTQPVVNAVYPFLYARVIFSFRPCEAAGEVRGAEQNLPWHTPEHGHFSLCSGIGCVCEGSGYWTIGFSHSAVNTRNLSRLGTGNGDADATEHCLGVVWSAGGKVDLFALLHDSHQPHKDDLSFTSDNLAVNNNGELVFGDNPKELEPQISLVKLRYKPTPKINVVFDKLWVVVNRSDTKTKFDNWYAQNADMSWTATLPRPFASIALATNATGEVTGPIDPEPGWFGGQWHAPEAKNTFLHHNAKYEMRSKPTSDGHGHQAMYDAHGYLITSPIAAGTADMYAPFYSIGAPRLSTKHLEQDVQPFIRALQLDGNPVLPRDIYRNLNRPCIYVGLNTDTYIKKRPVLPTGVQP